MKLTLKSGVILCAFVAVGATAGEADVVRLDDQVNAKANQIADAGLLPTATEMEVIKGDIVFEEMIKTGLTAEQAVDTYELTPTLERYIKIKDIQTKAAGNGNGNEPPQS